VPHESKGSNVGLISFSRVKRSSPSSDIVQPPMTPVVVFGPDLLMICWYTKILVYNLLVSYILSEHPILLEKSAKNEN
jgi:hypothetical protein